MKKFYWKLKPCTVSIVFLFCSTLFLSLNIFANGEVFPFGDPVININDKASLQRGARDYMNYCSGCHSLQYMRYEQLAQGAGITNNNSQVASEILQRNLMFTGDKITDHIIRAVKKDSIKQWVGIDPPDLTLEYNAKGGKWLYNYLLGFYKDEKRPWGVNNLVFKDVAMPNVLANLQGIQKPVYKLNLTDGGKQEVIDVQLIKKGEFSQSKYQAMVIDLVNFLAFVAEPMKAQRQLIGLYVILFLVVFIVIAWALKREFWKDVKK